MTAIASLGIAFPSPAWALLAGIVLTAGDILMKQWIVDELHPAKFFVPGFVLYIVGVFAISLSFFGQNIAIASMAAVLINVVSLILASTWLYDEPITLFGYLGLALATVSLVLLEFFA